MNNPKYPLKKFVSCFRQAIEIAKENMDLEQFKSFPLGTCSDVSVLLGMILMKNGYGHFHLVCGEIGEQDQTHAWLEKNDLIIDITADQFPEIKNKVIISRDSSWHNSFKNINKSPLTIFSLNILDDYEAIFKRFEIIIPYKIEKWTDDISRS
jgi:hypothetical protein